MAVAKGTKPDTGNVPTGASRVNRYGKVFCLEGDWDGDLTSRTSVLPTLELLERMRLIDFVHRDIGTREELKFYLDRWATEGPMEEYYVLYLACHGAKAQRDGSASPSLWLSNADAGEISLGDLADMLGSDLRNYIIHFGSCFIMNASDKVLQAFCDKTGVRAVAGYTRAVDWVESAAMDQLFLARIATYHQWHAARDAVERDQSARTLRQSLGFKIFSA